ncbi:MAG TPA: carbohydrate porin [Chthoniobacteraceae bacterium]|nr:carbohydrate porin [Chthoniobacteraceae bacterium]
MNAPRRKFAFASSRFARRAARAFACTLLVSLPHGNAQTTGSDGKPIQSGTAAAGSGFDDKATGDWDGARKRLQDAGISINSQLILEGFDNMRGGLRTGAVGSTTFDLNITVDTGRTLGLNGGSFYAGIEDHAFRNPSTALTGDLQFFDKNNADPYLQVFELWYQQLLFDGRFRIKLGKFDGNTEFGVIDNGLFFLTSAAQLPPSFFLLPTTPDPMPGALVSYTPVKSWYTNFGVFYSNRSDTFGDLDGHPQNAQPTANGVLFAGETGFLWDSAPFLNANGNLKLGVWGHTGTFTRLGGGTRVGAQGWYAILNQTLWTPPGDPPPGVAQTRGVRAYLEGGSTQSSVSNLDWNISGGLSWTGPCAMRPDDAVGLSASSAHISPQAGLPYSGEVAIEALYRIQLRKWAGIAPDLQYIIHPGGRYPNALVGTLQLTVQF